MRQTGWAGQADARHLFSLRNLDELNLEVVLLKIRYGTKLVKNDQDLPYKIGQLLERYSSLSYEVAAEL